MDKCRFQACQSSTWHGQTVSKGSQTIQLRLVRFILEIRRCAQDTCNEPDPSQYQGARLREHPTENTQYRNATGFQDFLLTRFPASFDSGKDLWPPALEGYKVWIEKDFTLCVDGRETDPKGVLILLLRPSHVWEVSFWTRYAQSTETASCHGWQNGAASR